MAPSGLVQYFRQDRCSTKTNSFRKLSTTVKYGRGGVRESPSSPEQVYQAWWEELGAFTSQDLGHHGLDGKLGARTLKPELFILFPAPSSFLDSR